MVYDRDALVHVLVHHYRVAPGKGCGCGWGSTIETLGASWPEHVADAYEVAAAERLDSSPSPYAVYDVLEPEVDLHG